jgi:tripeptide aminopeptidase
MKGVAANTASMGINISELAEQRGVRECLQWFTKEKLWINEAHLQLCRVPAPTFLEQERALWFQEQLRAAGWDASIDRAGNVVAALGQAPYVALTAHLDTVLAPKGKDDISVQPGGRFRGPGVSDNGAGLAALLAVARAWKNAGPPPEGSAGLLGAQSAGLRNCRWRQHRPHHHARFGQPPVRDCLYRAGRP